MGIFLPESLWFRRCSFRYPERSRRLLPSSHFPAPVLLCSDAAGAVRCAGYEIHIGFLSVYDAVRYDFGTVEECLVIFIFQNQYRFDRLIPQGYRHFDVSLETGGRSCNNFRS